ncbi:MAG TPA: hypothetical protein VER96_26335 [Polyangiaceae bacterium]|nr:hypothetical protein [Polyangiaceae bacterium]
MTGEGWGSATAGALAGGVATGGAEAVCAGLAGGGGEAMLIGCACVTAGVRHPTAEAKVLAANTIQRLPVLG